MQQKDLSKLSPEQLMEIAKLPLKADQFKDLPPVLRFILSEGLEQGDDKIPAIVIYSRYLKWCLAYGQMPISLKAFFLDFKNRFNRVKVRGGTAYILSPKGFDLSLQNINHAKGTSRGKRKKDKKNVST